jgi:hypothetical protein
MTLFFGKWKAVIKLVTIKIVKNGVIKDGT